MQTHARVVVVGGGVGGLSALYHLCREGWTDVVRPRAGDAGGPRAMPIARRTADSQRTRRSEVGNSEGPEVAPGATMRPVEARRPA